MKEKERPSGPTADEMLDLTTAIEMARDAAGAPQYEIRMLREVIRDELGAVVLRQLYQPRPVMRS